ncbi:type IV pilin-like G/H family protein [Tumidithrix elongata RA019]|uniref:Type IV pilin-like G/H family protein n=1 Tax=Tumidithrix elongata BACA0141 TaxID=2716417 RepID=A0AAW9PRN4_9CYAN|nr:type IV pilin-like G/H family protein [Tumidithrix elongata RA019]
MDIDYRTAKKGWDIWIKLLSAISFVGIVTAIALPSFLNQPCSSTTSKAIKFVGALNKGQQAFFKENNHKFGSSIDVLGVDTKVESVAYDYYSIGVKSKAAFSYAISKYQGLRSFVGGVFAVPVPNTSGVTTLAILCEANALGTIKPSEPFMKAGVPTCAPDTLLVGGNPCQAGNVYTTIEGVSTCVPET